MTSSKQYSLRRAFFDVGIFSFGVNLLMLVMPLYMLQIYDRVLTSSSIDTLVFLTVIAGFALVVLGVLEAVRSMYGTRIANRFDISYARPAMLHAMGGVDGPVGDTRIIQALGQVRNFLNSRLAFVVFDLPFAPLFIGILYFIHPILFWMTTGGVVVLVVVALINQWATVRAGERSSKSDYGVQLSGQALVANAESLRALGMTDNALRAWETHQLGMMESNDNRAGVGSFMTGMSRTIRLALQIAVLGVGAYLVLNREMTAGMIFAASIISGKGLQPIDQLIGSWRQIVEGITAWRTIRATVDLEKEQVKYTQFDAPKGEISAEGVVYYPVRIPGAKPTIQAISFSAPAGSCVGILGRSGAGKSTLLRLLAGAITPANGVVRIDNNDTKNWNPEALGRHIGYVEQRVELLPGTIAQNIARFDEDSSDEDIIAAARAAHVDAAIEAMPDSYQTLIGPGGQKLSGGEMQQVGLARAFYGDPQYLLLDEPNASLDPEARKQLDLAIGEARKAGKTIVMITQRDEVLKHVDLILAIKEGQRVDFGPRDEVLGRLFGAPAREAANQQVAPVASQKAAKPADGRSPFAEFGPGLRPVTASKSSSKKRIQ